MITMMTTKDDDLKNQRISSRCLRWSRLNQEHFKVQEEIWFQESRIKVQGSSFQESRSRFKTQDSRIKRRINQDKYEKVFSKTE